MRKVWCWASALVLATTSVACSKSSSGETSSSGRIVNLKGGKGLTNDGGTGGYFDIEGNTGAAGVHVLGSGSVHTATALPNKKPYLGTNAQIVTGSVTLQVGTTGFHLSKNSGTVSNADGAVTGIWVKPGAVLTIKPNEDVDADFVATTYERVNMSLSDGLIVEGTIQIAKKDSAAALDGLGTDTGDFTLGDIGGFWVGPEGRIVLDGTSNASGAGGNAGYFEVYPDAAYVAGVLSAKGGTGTTNGGNGGYLYVYTNVGYAVGVGSMIADGGNGGTGSGGNAGYIDFESGGGYGALVAKGTYSATGGDAKQGGGDGNYVHFYANYGGIYANATIRSNGGDATATDGHGGSGGYVGFDAWGETRVAGVIQTFGGKGLGTGNGGDGGYVNVNAYADRVDNLGEDADDSMPLTFGASVDTHGGDGAFGGSGGYFKLWNDDGGYATIKGAPVKMVGFAKLDASGGDGKVNGGNAGSGNKIESWHAYDRTNTYAYAGSVTNEAALVLRGGKGTTGSGGSSSDLSVETESYGYLPGQHGVTNKGSIDARGGDGATSGGSSGSVYVYGKAYIDGGGAIDVSGGNGGTSSGGDGNIVRLYAEGGVTCGNLTANGGNSTGGSAGSGGSFYVYAGGPVRTGAVTATGGTSTSGAGGKGGYAWIMGQDAPSAVGAVNLSAGSGTGSPTGGEGWVDGMQVCGP
jgi:hypothetical protein